MNKINLGEAYRCLELPLDSPPLQVERTYRRKRALYAEESLATYSLFDETGREGHLARLEEAYLRICGAAAPPRPAVPEPLAANGSPSASAELSPGKYLRSRREAARMTLQEIADRTKIGTRKLAQIEEEHYQQLPAPVYLRGFLLAYARSLGLPDADSVTTRYLERCRAAVGEP